MPPRRISDDLRWAVVRLTSLGNSTEYVSMASGLNERQVRGINQMFEETGAINGNHNAPRPGRPRILGNRHVNYMMSRLERHNDMFLDEIQADLYMSHGVDISITTVWRELHRNGITRKKVDRRAIERCEFTRLGFRQRFVARYRPEHAVFVDESSIDRRTTYRNYGYAPSGFRVHQRAHFVRGTRYSMLPSLSLDGILNLQVIVGSFTAELFHGFIEQLLEHMQPFPAPKSVIVMDNCRIHQWQTTLNMITERGMLYEFLPPYSPDFNPIELAFSAIKSRIRRGGDLVRLAMTAPDGDQDAETIATIFDHVYATTPEQARSWFEACHYH